MLNAPLNMQAMEITGMKNMRIHMLSLYGDIK
jgi:hypothetical protein